MRIDDVTALLEAPGVRRAVRDGRSVWTYHGRIVARELDEEILVIRAEFDAREGLVRTHPETFSVPRRFAKHMMVVADLVGGNEAAIEDALAAAVALQRRNDLG